MDTTGRITLEIIRRIREEDLGGIEAFVKHLGPRLLVFARYKIGEKLRSRLEPEDVLQDIYAAIVENREGFLDKVDRRGLHRAIYRMIENRIRDLYEHHFLVEKRSGHREVPAACPSEGGPRRGVELDKLASPATSISSRIALEDEYRSLCEILDLLPEGSRRLFVMKFIQELTNQEIADELSTSVSTLKREVAELIRTIQRIRAARKP
jgi:RNA polymerase sigma factor (sigma-70 family)